VIGNRFLRLLTQQTTCQPSHQRPKTTGADQSAVLVHCHELARATRWTGRRASSQLLLPLHFDKRSA